MNIGMNIKNRREKLGITQKQMAENLSLTQSMIAQVERNEDPEHDLRPCDCEDAGLYDGGFGGRCER
mgnify:CR=1 FL=1